ncbi:hypothetical protein AF306_09830 [Listeria monocytogenes]|nr:hypothetical protein [Listeria monocytogenes]EAD8589547.1 hypothetical protein [Listeria monocytogenes]EAD8592656.1 hypothetical protein [Listeria monocytogenes]EAD8601502.1 hypothetical protein [Listeria monocytogenes]
MLEVIFLNGRDLDIQEGLKLEYEQAQKLCERKNEELLARTQERVCYYQLVSQDKVVYESKLQFPYEFFDFHEILVQEVGEQEGADEFITWFESQTNYKKSKLLKGEKNKEAKKGKVRKERSNRIRNTPNLKVRLGLFFMVMCLLAAGIGLFFAFSGADKEQTLSDLMKQGKYVQAAKAYPSEQTNIYEELLDKAMAGEASDKKMFREYSKIYSTDTTAFDKAVLEGNYQEVIAAYEANSTVIEKDEERYAIVGYAYLKDKNLSAAKKITEKTENLDLEKRIAHYEQLILSITNREKKIQDLQKDPIKNEETIKKEIDLLYKDKEALAKL